METQKISCTTYHMLCCHLLVVNSFSYFSLLRIQLMYNMSKVCDLLIDNLCLVCPQISLFLLNSDIYMGDCMSTLLKVKILEVMLYRVGSYDIMLCVMPRLRCYTYCMYILLLYITTVRTYYYCMYILLLYVHITTVCTYYYCMYILLLYVYITTVCTYYSSTDLQGLLYMSVTVGAHVTLLAVTESFNTAVKSNWPYLKLLMGVAGVSRPNRI